MKRCPECLFIYPESDERCDFDNAVLVIVNDSEIEAATKPDTTVAESPAKKPRGSSKKPRRGKKAVLAAGAVLILLGLLASLVYYGLSKIAGAADAQASAANIPVIAVPVLAAPPPPLPLPSPAASPSPTIVETHKHDSQRVATSHSTASVDPVSTSGPGMGTRRGGKPVILLTSGGRIDADEVWRTRDGVWYRRNGMVTLLKRNRVKAIVNQ